MVNHPEFNESVISDHSRQQVELIPDSQLLSESLESIELENHPSESIPEFPIPGTSDQGNLCLL